MDEMRIKLSSKLMCSMIAKWIVGIVKKKTGIKMELNINSIETELVNGKIYFHIDIEGEADEKILLKVDRIAK